MDDPRGEGSGGAEPLRSAVLALFAGAAAFTLTPWASPALALALGAVLALTVGNPLPGRRFRVEGETSFLITAGTSIFGGSAIAAVGPVIGARSEAMSVALATVFVLNLVALYLFPARWWRVR